MTSSQSATLVHYIIFLFFEPFPKRHALTGGNAELMILIGNEEMTILVCIKHESYLSVLRLVLFDFHLLVWKLKHADYLYNCLNANYN